MNTFHKGLNESPYVLDEFGNMVDNSTFAIGESLWSEGLSHRKLNEHDLPPDTSEANCTGLRADSLFRTRHNPRAGAWGNFSGVGEAVTGVAQFHPSSEVAVPRVRRRDFAAQWRLSQNQLADLEPQGSSLSSGLPSSNARQAIPNGLANPELFCQIHNDRFAFANVGVSILPANMMGIHDLYSTQYRAYPSMPFDSEFQYQSHIHPGGLWDLVSASDAHSHFGGEGEASTTAFHIVTANAVLDLNEVYSPGTLTNFRDAIAEIIEGPASSSTPLYGSDLNSLDSQSEHSNDVAASAPRTNRPSPVFYDPSKPPQGDRSNLPVSTLSTKPTDSSHEIKIKQKRYLP
jgi:hypothetical protein